MKISYDSSIDRYIVADGLKVLSFTPAQFTAMKTMSDLKSEFHKRLDNDRELCYNQNILRDEETE